MPPVLHVVTSCTERKRGEISPNLQAGALRGKRGAINVETWWSRLVNARGIPLPAEDLYLGDHWSVARQSVSVGQDNGWTVGIWVASAGYGLVPAQAKLLPYSATFLPNKSDSVVSYNGTNWRAEVKAWWQALSQKPGPQEGAPRSLKALASSNPEATIVVAASDTYITAMEEDLLKAQEQLADPQRLLLLTSAPGPHPATLQNAWIRVEANLSPALGGALGSLHARVARYLIETIPSGELTAAKAKEAVATLASEQGYTRTFDRVPLQDSEVISFIKRSLRQDPYATHTRLLRKLRDEGKACEQKRFRRLFLTVQGER